MSFFSSYFNFILFFVTQQEQTQNTQRQMYNVFEFDFEFGTKKKFWLVELKIGRN